MPDAPFDPDDDLYGGMPVWTWKWALRVGGALAAIAAVVVLLRSCG